MSSRAHQALADADGQSISPILNLEDLAREEQYHRGRAVSVLNAQLADHHQRLSDSVLATLLILCLFHGCDTGVAQFKTQYAGVMKLLAIRIRASSEIPDDLKWFIRVFTWYDTMTAITNDREAQLRGVCLQIASSADSERGLEILTGCDTQIFRYVTQLGRLNLLSQNRAVTTPALSELSLPSAAVPPSMAYAGLSTAAQDMFGTSFLSQSSRSHAGKTDQSSMSSAFWAEWFSLRQKLVSWRLNPQASASTCGPEASFTDVMGMDPSLIASRQTEPQDTTPTRYLDDVYHISECFRHAAILYTERLAHPHLSSSHPQFQTLVDLTMQHIAAVKSDVYLLWPLFIAGSECVLESHRSTIRQRCRDIARDSGFLNNISCLEVLEKIWLDDSPDDGALNFSPQILNGVNPVLLAETMSAHSASDGSIASPAWVPSEKMGLRWHKAMKANGAVGEYMVV
ncbi:fungal-specific transcription factor domain-containing protein [Aspergillus floccosus]